MPPPATSDPVDWYPARLLRERPPTDEGDESAIKEQSKFALIILNQPLRDVPTLKKLWENCMQALNPPNYNPMLVHENSYWSLFTFSRSCVLIHVY